MRNQYKEIEVSYSTFPPEAGFFIADMIQYIKDQENTAQKESGSHTVLVSSDIPLPDEVQAQKKEKSRKRVNYGIDKSKLLCPFSDIGFLPQTQHDHHYQYDDRRDDVKGAYSYFIFHNYILIPGNEFRVVRPELTT